MASSKVMASRSPPNPDLPRQPTPSPLNFHSSDAAADRGVGSCNMDDLFRNIYSDSGNVEMINGNGNKTVDEVWREIVGGGGGNDEPAMTLEVFLAKAGAVNEEDVRVPAAVAMTPPPAAGYGVETAMMSPAVQFAPNGGFGAEFGNGMAAATGGGGRGKRRAAVEEAPLDKATQQKQRRMIKNRESAARSRERKQAYTVELESLVTQLEEDNARLLKEEAELNKERYKQLMENLIPVVEKRKPPRVLRSVRSMEW